MSKTVQCPDCGQPMDVPAYPGDGVYREHHCSLDVLRFPQRDAGVDWAVWCHSTAEVA